MTVNAVIAGVLGLLTSVEIDSFLAMLYVICTCLLLNSRVIVWPRNSSIT